MGVSARLVSTKPLKFAVFFLRFRVRPGEPIKLITYDCFFIDYCSARAQAIDSSFAILIPDSGSRFDLSLLRQFATDLGCLILLYLAFLAIARWGYFWGYRRVARSNTPSTDAPDPPLQTQHLLDGDRGDRDRRRIHTPATRCGRWGVTASGISVCRFNRGTPSPVGRSPRAWLHACSQVRCTG